MMRTEGSGERAWRLETGRLPTADGVRQPEDSYPFGRAVAPAHPRVCWARAAAQFATTVADPYLLQSESPRLDRTDTVGVDDGLRIFEHDRLHHARLAPKPRLEVGGGGDGLEVRMHFAQCALGLLGGGAMPLLAERCSVLARSALTSAVRPLMTTPIGPAISGYSSARCASAALPDAGVGVGGTHHRAKVSRTVAISRP